MDALACARALILREPAHPDAVVLARLIQALHDEQAFEVASLYDLGIDAFDLALRVLRDWRLQRYYLGTAVAFQAGSAAHVAPPDRPLLS